VSFAIQEVKFTSLKFNLQTDVTIIGLTCELNFCLTITFALISKYARLQPDHYHCLGTAI